MASKRIKQRTKSKLRLGRGRNWIAMGALAAYSAAGTGKVAIAQEPPKEPGHARPADQIQGFPVRRYEIPAGPLKDVVAAFENIAAIKVSVAEDGIFAIQSPGVCGRWTAEQALQQILANTGLQYRFTSNNSVVIELKQAVTSTEVIASAPTLAASMPKYQQPLIDTPQTVSVVPQQTIQEQGVTTLRDALRNVAGISLAAGEGGSQGDNLTIRGFTARNDLFIDGMRDFGSYYRDPFNTQELEVLQGPSSVTFGRGSTGGVVNQASKTPDLNRHLSAGLQFGTDATRRAALDMNVPIPALGSGAAFRFNAMGTIGDVAGRDVAENRRDGFAPSLALGLGTPTRLTLSYFHQNEDDIPDYGIPWLFNGPAPVNRANYYGLEDGNFLRTYADIGTVKAEHDVNSRVMLRDQFRYANYSRAALITEPQIKGAELDTPLSDMSVTRHQIAVNSTETFLDDQLDLIAHVETGRLQHLLVTGVEAGRETSDPTRPNYTAPNTSLLDPDPTQQLNPNPSVQSRVKDSAVSTAAYVVDTISLGNKWDFTAGLRFDRFDNTYDQSVAPVSHLHRVDAKPTWRTAVVYKPVANGRFYFDAGTSFNPSAETLSLNAGSANVPPETNKTYEFGTKWDFNKGRLTVNSSWFRTTKENAREPDPANPLLYVLAGTQQVNGVEADVRGRITSRWDILASYAYLDSKVVSSQYYPLAVGYPLANVPRNTFAYWNEYHLPRHFEFGIGANYESSRTASSTVPLDPVTGLVRQVPGYWVFNAMVGHPINDHIAIQVNAYNLANRYYYDQIHPGHIVPGLGRLALVDLKFNF